MKAVVFGTCHAGPWPEKSGKPCGNSPFCMRVACLVFIYISLIQISSSSKHGKFLWTGWFFYFKSSTWRLFNPVASCHAMNRVGMNNFQVFHQPVDKS